MTIQIFIKYALAIVVAIIYFVYTIRFSKELKKNILFSKKLRVFHLLMIWLMPFLWIFVIKDFTKSAPGSYEIDEKKENEPFSNPHSIGE